LGTSGELYDHGLLDLNQRPFIEAITLTAPRILAEFTPE
jgi:hypothetical protein